MNILKITTLFLSALLILGCGAQQEATTEVAQPAGSAQAAELNTLEQKISYLIGYNGAAELSSQGLDIDEAAYVEGIREFLAGGESVFSAEETQSVFTEFQTKIQNEAQAEFESLAVENAQRAAVFLEENAAKEGVVTTDSGLQYTVLEEGEGDLPSVDSTVQVHYEGRLINGEVFDSSIARGTPVEFALTQVIPGWTEGLQLMKEGAKWQFYIPSELAYGASGNRGIGPNEALIFDVELLQANFEPEAAAEE